MAKFTSQEQLRIIRTMGIDITGATEPKIKYIDPNDARGEWPATVSDDTTGTMYHDITSPLGIPGTWKTWASIIDSTGKYIPGEVSELIITEEGKIA